MKWNIESEPYCLEATGQIIIPNGPMELRIERDHIFAKGLGPAYMIHNYFPNNGWEADLRYSWTY
ncbi:hypothetical protein [Paenibacillus sp. J2TS4]|uniref:hypothetical protein n=1 Tax=Paenibacillus sp. J2TS4 TaxID=2807194 RepID=UPI001BD189BA|nr:hypothetical protein [Paenibacillus sp. J2TS4]